MVVKMNFKNEKKGFVTKSIRYKSEKEYKDLINALNENRISDILDIIYEIFYRNDL